MKPSPQKRVVDKEKILSRLKSGPASMIDLMSVCPGGYRQRMSDLREDGYIIRCDRTKNGSVFRLLGRRDDGQMQLELVA